MSHLIRRTALHRSVRAPVRGLSVLLATALALFVTVTPGFAVSDTEVTVGSDDNIFSQNKQNEPAIAIDPTQPNVLAAGANDNIDMEACNAGNPTTCPFTPGVGVTGIQFSFDTGGSWVQPEYTGLSARGCLGPAACTPTVGPIGTLPWYYEAGLVSNGDPALAFGPKPRSGGAFSWANGSRLYVANITTKVSGLPRDEQAFKGFAAIAVSRTDDVSTAALGGAAGKAAWMHPVIVSQHQSSTVFADKEQIWADNAASSPHFGNVYVCFSQYRSLPGAAAPMMVARSTDGGDTWDQRQVSPAFNVPPTHWGQSGCTIRTDSQGTVYVFYEAFQSPFVFLPPHGTHTLVKSFDGGSSWTRPQALFRVTDPCYFIDPVISRCVMDGVAGARNDLSAGPSVDIANGAPTGTGATNEIAITWVDGRDGQNNEHVMFSYSTDGGRTWAPEVPIETGSADRGYYSAAAISPDGTHVYVVYNAFTTPFRDNTFDPRSLVGILLHADIGIGGTPGTWTELHRGTEGDPRGSAQNNLVAEFLGDYVYAAATNDYVAAVWNDVRNAADCPAIDAWRMSIRTGGSVPRPEPQNDCAPTFGNTDIVGITIATP